MNDIYRNNQEALLVRNDHLQMEVAQLKNRLRVQSLNLNHDAVLTHITALETHVKHMHLEMRKMKQIFSRRCVLFVFLLLMMMSSHLTKILF